MHTWLRDLVIMTDHVSMRMSTLICWNVISSDISYHGNRVTILCMLHYVVTLSHVQPSWWHATSSLQEVSWWHNVYNGWLYDEMIVTNFYYGDDVKINCLWSGSYNIHMYCCRLCDYIMCTTCYGDYAWHRTCTTMKWINFEGLWANPQTILPYTIATLSP